MIQSAHRYPSRQNTCFITSSIIALLLSASMFTLRLPPPLNVITTWSSSTSDKPVISRSAHSRVFSKTDMNSFLVMGTASCSCRLFIQPYYGKCYKVVNGINPLWERCRPQTHIRVSVCQGHTAPDTMAPEPPMAALSDIFLVEWQVSVHTVRYVHVAA